MLNPWATYDFYSKKTSTDFSKKSANYFFMRHIESSDTAQSANYTNRYFISLIFLGLLIHLRYPKHIFLISICWTTGPWGFDSSRVAPTVLQKAASEAKENERDTVSCGWIPGNSSWPFLGWLSDPFNSYVTLQLGDLWVFNPFFLFFFRLVSLPIDANCLDGSSWIFWGTKWYKILPHTSMNQF